ncbi:MAG: energy transducer TonB, partial [Deltaproteobacteria bacterium]
PLRVPADPLPEMARVESVPDLSRESMPMLHPPAVNDLNISEWNPTEPVAQPEPPTSEVQPEITEEDYRDIVDRKIRGSVQYPKKAKERNLQGRVTIAVTIDAEGEITGLKITQSSGHRILDRSVLKAVKESAPFSNPPDGPVTVIIPIQFRLI